MGVFKSIFAFAFLFVISSEVHAGSISTPIIPDKVFEVFHTKIRPHLMKAYKSYYDNYGEKLDTGMLEAYDYLSPKIQHVYENDVDFWYKQNPEFFDDFSKVPTPVKIAHEQFLFALWGAIQKFSPEQITSVSQKFAKPTKMIFEANLVRQGKKNVAAAEQQRLERLLNDLRNYAVDKEMRSCFRVYGVPSDIINAFNTGCYIFVNKALYDGLNDDELRAALSHEMSHGSAGDGLKTFSHVFTTVFKHVTKLSIENLTWLLTDDEMEYMKETYEKGNGEMIISGVGSQAPALEIRADKNGAILLNSAGYSAEPMIGALTKLDAMVIELKKKQQKEGIPPTGKSVRNYPSLNQRIEAIKEVMKF